MTVEADAHAGAIVSDVGGVLLADGMRTMIELLGAPIRRPDFRHRSKVPRQRSARATLDWHDLYPNLLE